MKKQNGFTLIELLVVISIISILSMVGFVSYQNVRNSALSAKRKADIDAIKKAYETNFDPTLNGGQGGYKPLTGANFASDSIPVPDSSQTASSINTYFVVSPSSNAIQDNTAGSGSSAYGSNFLICAPIGNSLGSSVCGRPGDTSSCYCQSSTAGTPITTSADSLPSVKYIFASSAVYNGNLGGTAGADTKCRTLATAANLSGTYRAWLSSATSNPTNFSASTMPYVLTDGVTKVANNWTGLISGTLLHAINMDEARRQITSGTTGAWTNTTSTGTAVRTTDDLTCHQWTVGTTQEALPGGSFANRYGYSGYLTSATETWTYISQGYAACSQQYRLYCVEQ